MIMCLIVGIDHVGFAGDFTDSIEKVKLGEMLPGHGLADSASNVKASPTKGSRMVLLAS